MQVTAALPITAWVLCCTATLSAQYDPHPSHIDYTENFRGQYHFSPKSEWMNDINGLVYQGGKYHMIYQWGDRIRHGGYATSPDLLHWTDEGVALIPQGTFLPKGEVNVSGNEVYSGSAVVVKGETARAITGSAAEAIIAVYTGTGKGTCLAWSNDTGRTWHNFPGNPVANPTGGTDPRDPRVFWYDDPVKGDGDASKWILAIYENGTTFYGSSNLINWTKLSNIAFGYECPDIFQLPLDGKATTMKWVLLDASGAYLVGQFNGTTFTTDPGQQKHLMDVGPDFYAAQSFPMGGLPGGLPGNDPRIIQIAWNDHWNGGVGETGWQRNATFPVELALITLEGQEWLVRNPIREISKIHESGRTWSEESIGPGTTLLNAIKSKKFDLTAEFDLTGAGATRFGFTVANRTIEYDVAAKTLLGKSLPATAGNRVKIRLLVDWGQFTVFGNGGIFSYSQQFAFTPRDSSLKLTANGSIKLVSMEFQEVARIWGPISNATKVDDPKATYSGTWNTVDNEDVYFNRTAHFGNTVGAYFETSFTGTSISWYGLKNSDLGYADVHIDGVLAAKGIDCYSSNRSVHALFSKANLPNGNHTIRVTVTGGKNAASSGHFLVHDFFSYSASLPTGALTATPGDRGNLQVRSGPEGVQMRLPWRGDYALSIFDAYGRVVAAAHIRNGLEARFPADGFKTGVYYAEAVGEGRAWKRKVAIFKE